MRMFYREYREDWTSFLTVRILDSCSPLVVLAMHALSDSYLLSTHSLYAQSTCAVIGGVFTVFGMVVALLDTSSEVFSKKSI